jgi:mono/diheme cytochrome c family protein
MAQKVGDPQAGLDYAKQVCSKCHGISAEKSPLPRQTLLGGARFREVADRPGMTATALTVWLQTSHPTMPNIIVEPEDMRNVIARLTGGFRGRSALQWIRPSYSGVPSLTLQDRRWTETAP